MVRAVFGDAIYAQLGVRLRELGAECAWQPDLPGDHSDRILVVAAISLGARVLCEELRTEPTSRVLLLASLLVDTANLVQTGYTTANPDVILACAEAFVRWLGQPLPPNEMLGDN